MVVYCSSRSDRLIPADICPRQVICVANCIGKEWDLQRRLPSLKSICEGKSGVLQSIFLGSFDAALDAYIVWKQCCLVYVIFKVMIGVRVEI